MTASLKHIGLKHGGLNHRRYGLLAILFARLALAADDPEQWTVYGGDAGGTRFSSLDSINVNNARHLQRAWSYRTGDVGAGFPQPEQLAFASTPIYFSDLLYLSTPSDIVIALDPQTGHEQWRYDPGIARSAQYKLITSRGVAAWQDPQPMRISACMRRIFVGTLDARVIALDANTGKPCGEFGLGGSVQFDPSDKPSRLAIIVPPITTRDLVIVAGTTDHMAAASTDRQTMAALIHSQSHSLLRAFDARTGALRWTFTASASNASSGNINISSALSWDAALGLIYVATGSPETVELTPTSQNEKVEKGDAGKARDFANSLVALHANDGSVAWSKQLVHHDAWNYSLTAQPTLIDIDRNGDSINAVVQATKMGTLFILDRESGSPVNEVIERPMHHEPSQPNSSQGNTHASTQPFTTIPPLVSHTALTPSDAWGLTFYDRAKCRTLISTLQSDGIYTSPTTSGSIQSPGDEDGIGWGGVAIDRDKQILIAAVNHLPMSTRLVNRRNDGSKADTLAVQRTPLQSPFDLPCSPPPWGTLAAIDLQRNAILWQRPLGSARGFGPWFMPTRDIGGPTVGGPIVTAGGIILIAATSDNYFRAFSSATGQELWKDKLPASGHATPMTYEINGRQFIVIAAGGSHQFGATQGDYVVAYTLPTPEE